MTIKLIISKERFSHSVEHACLTDGKELLYIMVEKDKLIQSISHQKLKVLVTKQLKIPFEFSCSFHRLYIQNHSISSRVLSYRGTFELSAEDFFFIKCKIINTVENPIQHIKLGWCHATG